MAKPPETRDRFKIHAEVSKGQMGDVLAELTRMGLEGIGYELITDVKAWGRKVHDITAAEAIAEYVQEHPTFKIGDLVGHFKENGRTPGAAYTAVKTMLAKGLLRKLDPGNYQSADVKALAPPARTEKTKKTGKGESNSKHYEISNYDLIWRHIKNRTRFKLADLRFLFRHNGRPEQSVSPLMTKMVGEKLIKLIGPGEYLMLKKAIKASVAAKKKANRSKHQPAPEPANLTGPARASSEIVVNG